VSEISGTVVALRTTPVKGLALRERSELALTAAGVAGNRAFYVIDERGRMLNAKVLGALCAVAADYEPDSRKLTLRFPGGARVAGAAIPGEPLATRFFSRTLSARLIDGPFSGALSAHVGRPLRLVAADPRRGGVDRGRAGAVSLVSLASLRWLGELAGREVDPRRFRMLVEVDGLEAHEEDGLVGRRARLGEALVAFRGHVGRCIVTTRNPDSGEVDLPTLELLDYRREAATSEPLAFGVYGEVLEPGRVRLGDRLRSPAR
jgi:uncharacterized protein YcbX